MLQNARKFGITIDRAPKHLNSSLIFLACESDFNEKILELLNGKNYQVSSTTADVNEPEQNDEIIDDSDEVDKFFADIPLDVFNFDLVSWQYLSSRQIDFYLEKAVEAFNKINPNITTQLYLEKDSYENRMIRTLYLSYRRKNNPTVLIDAGKDLFNFLI